MPSPDFTTFAVRDKACSTCNGEGFTSEETERGTTLIERCWSCGGHGCRTIRVTEKT